VARIEANLEAAAMLRAASGEAWIATRIAVHESPPAASAFAPGRRQLFRRLLGRAADEVARAAIPVVAPEAAPARAIRAARVFVTEQRELLQIIAKTGEGGGFPVREHEALPVLKFATAVGCTGCEACFRACPTGALQVRETDTAWSLTFRLDHCVACEVCIEVCQPRALRPVPEFDAAPSVAETVLHALNKQRCQRCDRAFVSPTPEQTCGICADDDHAFDAIFG
jgi:ferredoxin